MYCLMKTSSQSSLMFKYALIQTTLITPGHGSPPKPLMQTLIQSTALETEEHHLIPTPLYGLCTLEIKTGP